MVTRPAKCSNEIAFPYGHNAVRVPESHPAGRRAEARLRPRLAWRGRGGAAVGVCSAGQRGRAGRGGPRAAVAPRWLLRT
jgi:hypothetical protein